MDNTLQKSPTRAHSSRSSTGHKALFLFFPGIRRGAFCQVASRAHDYAKQKGVDVTLRIVEPEETGAEHCQHDNPTIGEEYMFDWLADRFEIDQRQLLAQ